jgi:hypothetical protein
VVWSHDGPGVMIAMVPTANVVVYAGSFAEQRKGGGSGPFEMIHPQVGNILLPKRHGSLVIPAPIYAIAIWV